MKKITAMLIAGITIAGCNNSGGDIYLGKWSSANTPAMTLEVTKHDGGSGYTVTRYTDKHRVIESYSGIDDGKTINLSLPTGVKPIEMKGSQLSVDLIPSCYEANCTLWNKVSN